MSIFAYVGLPGSGKSYSVVQQQILPALKAGRTVVTNVPLKWDLVRAELGVPAAQLREFPMEAVQADPELIMEAAPPGAVLVLDEVWRIFPAGLKANQVPEQFRAVFAEHRHRVNAEGESSQIVLVTQDLAQIAAFARQLVEQTFRTTKLTTVGLSRRYRTDVYAGPVTGPNPPVNTAIRQIFGRYDPAVYRFYHSHTQSQAAKEGADERAIDRRGNVLLRPVVLLAPVLVIALLWFGVSHLYARQRQLKAVQTEQRAAGGRASAPSSRLSAPVSAAVGSRLAVRSAAPASWRVSGTFQGHGDLAGQAWLTDGERTVWVRLSECRVSRWDVACPMDGVFWDREGRSQPAVSRPVGPWSGATVAAR